MPFHEVLDLEAREQFPGFHGRFIHTERVTVAYWEIDAGVNLPEHSHEQISHLLEGEFEMTIDRTTHTLTAGSVAVVPTAAVHSGRTLTKCRFINVFQH